MKVQEELFLCVCICVSVHVGSILVVLVKVFKVVSQAQTDLVKHALSLYRVFAQELVIFLFSE